METRKTIWKTCKNCGAKIASNVPDKDFLCVSCKHPDTEPYFEYPEYDDDFEDNLAQDIQEWSEDQDHHFDK